MSSESFSTSPTRQIEAGDTPGFNDDQISRNMAVENIPKGTPTFQVNGVITIVTDALAIQNFAPFVPVESKDNSLNLDLEIRGIGPLQQVAMELLSGTLNPGDYVQVNTTGAGQIIPWNKGANQRRYARYFGKEAGVFSRDGSTPFSEDLSVGVIPDQPLTAGQIGWFTLLEASD